MIRRIRIAVAFLLVLNGAALSQALQAIPFSYLSTASTNSTLVNGSGQDILKWILATNTTSTTYYLKVYDTSSAPSCGSGTPKLRIPLLPNSTGNGQLAAGFDDTRFPSGIGFCLTGALADNDTTNAATGVTINIGYLAE